MVLRVAGFVNARRCHRYDGWRLLAFKDGMRVRLMIYVLPPLAQRRLVLEE
jgi:hypothetical protein